MKFTDRFIEVPIELFNKDVGDLIGSDKADTMNAVAKINPFEISFYREAMEQSEDASDDLNKVIVYFKNGESLYLPISLSAFEKLLNAHS